MTDNLEDRGLNPVQKTVSGGSPMAETEKQLMDKLNPEERQYHPDSQAKKEKFAKKAGYVLTFDDQPDKRANQYYQIGRFIALWETFQSRWQPLICPNCPHFR